ncbi:MAG: D-alanyl-D-alanine carboxypeptidase, partial [Bacillus sp. (in: Bacteria)]|nr:D-alanyl-D-alanine carboxypeptidase [Bacillus sp. (in: firmicutes)]
KKGENVDQIKKEIKLTQDVTAPFSKGTKLGTIILKKDGKVLHESPVEAKEDMEKAGVWTFFKRAMAEFVKWK